MTVTPIYLTWLNYLGGFEYFFFTAKKSYQVQVGETGTFQKNVLPSWPNSYGKNADTIQGQSFRKTRNEIIVRSQHLTVSQVDALSYIRTSPVVQIVEGRTDRRTVTVDADSFVKYDEADNLFSIQFKISYTDEIPSQRV